MESLEEAGNCLGGPCMLKGPCKLRRSLQALEVTACHAEASESAAGMRSSALQAEFSLAHC